MLRVRFFCCCSCCCSLFLFVLFWFFLIVSGLLFFWLCCCSSQFISSKKRKVYWGSAHHEGPEVRKGALVVGLEMDGGACAPTSKCEYLFLLFFNGFLRNFLLQALGKKNSEPLLALFAWKNWLGRSSVWTCTLTVGCYQSTSVSVTVLVNTEI